jgi:murein DD-endopeptidase MepM/ murein hydrolase activator NlpD
MDELSQPMAPGSYTISSGYGMRGNEMHKGVDYAATKGTPIYAAYDGTVVAAGAASGFGQWIILDHQLPSESAIDKLNKVSTVYGHMYPDGVLVHTGAIVTRGQHIANVGANGAATGPHLHFEVWPGGRLTGGHAVNPTLYLAEFAGAGGQGDIKTGGELKGKTITYPWAYLSQGVTWIRVLEFLAGIAVIGFLLWQIINQESPIPLPI